MKEVSVWFIFDFWFSIVNSSNYILIVIKLSKIFGNYCIMSVFFTSSIENCNQRKVITNNMFTLHILYTYTSTYIQTQRVSNRICVFTFVNILYFIFLVGDFCIFVYLFLNVLF